MLKPVKFSPFKEKSRHLTRTFCLSLVALIFSAAVAFAQDGEAASGGADDGIPSDPAVISAGEALFKQNCTVCHAVNDRVVGPALRDIHVRRPLPWIISFVQNSQKVIQSGDDYAVKLYNEYNKTQMTSFDFSNEEITSIVAYLKAESTKPTETAATTTTAADGQVAQGGGSGVPSEYINIILIGLLVVLALILLVLVLIVSVLTKYLAQKDDLDEEDKDVVQNKFDLGKTLKGNTFMGFAVFIFTAIVLKSVIDGLFTVGVQQGYQPAQPIAFSHKLHAGQMEIDCNYCHTGVRTSKSANIPSPNICMNCHTVIQNVGGQTGMSPEIQKIYNAIDNNQPIEWVRVHNLPDLAYFNHSQHVKVGGLECQTCHGEIQEMDVVYQFAPLTMGWCVNCHRETQINTKDNAYYDKLVELHEKKSKKPMTVEDNGGLECAKCHY
jgi:mono/diheme cytochrome c family protein